MQPFHLLAESKGSFYLFFIPFFQFSYKYFKIIRPKTYRGLTPKVKTEGNLPLETQRICSDNTIKMAQERRSSSAG